MFSVIPQPGSPLGPAAPIAELTRTTSNGGFEADTGIGEGDHEGVSSPSARPPFVQFGPRLRMRLLFLPGPQFLCLYDGDQYKQAWDSWR